MFLGRVGEGLTLQNPDDVNTMNFRMGEVGAHELGHGQGFESDGATWNFIKSIFGQGIVCFTWFGWFSVGGPFTLQELVGVDLSDPAAISRAETMHLLKPLAVYFIMVLISSLPLLMRWAGGRRSHGGPNAPGEAPNPAFQHH